MFAYSFRMLFITVNTVIVALRSITSFPLLHFDKHFEVCLSIGYAFSAALVSKSIFPQIFFLQSANIADLDSMNNSLMLCPFNKKLFYSKLFKGRKTKTQKTHTKKFEAVKNFTHKL